jgi:dolichol-phosphate mannosyltransferase
MAKNSGQSAALVAGMQRAKGDFVFILDGDLQNDPCDIPKMADLLADHDCVFGYRGKRQDTWVKKKASKIANAVRQSLLQDGVRDAGCGSKGFRRHCVKHIISFNGQHRFFAVMMQVAGMSIVECEVTHHSRQFGESKYGISNRLWRGIYDLFGVRWLKRRYVPIAVEGEDDGD